MMRLVESLNWRAAAAIVLMAFVWAGCGGSGSTFVPAPTPTPQALKVTAQPSTQAVRLGQRATFSVTVTGTSPITYQWNKNGSPISGAIGSSYTHPATVAADNDSVFNVVVTNPAGSVTSGNVRLILNPPLDGDLRFQQVDAVSTRDRYVGFMATGIVGGVSQSWGDYGSPFRFTPLDHCAPDANPRNCAWFFSLFLSPASGLTSSYQSGLLSDFQNDLGKLSSDTVITSLDLEPANNAYATSWIKSSLGGEFTPVSSQSVLPADFQTVASQEGAVGHVITAVGFNAGMVLYVSYGWQNAPATTYEVKVATATLNTMVTQIAALAQEGYILSAAGGDTTNGFLLIGTRVQGDTMPRRFRVVTTPNEDVTTLLWGQGYALVAAIDNAPDPTHTWIGEK